MTHVDTLGTTIKIDGIEIKYISLDTIPIPDGDTKDKDTSTLGSGTVMEKGLGMFDPGSCEITGNYIAGDAGQIALEAAFSDRALHAFEVNVVEAGTVFTYNAFVTKYTPGSKDNTFIFSANLLASGKFTKSTTFAGITSVAASAVGAKISPTIAGSALASTSKNIVIAVPTAISSTTFTVTAAASTLIELSKDAGTTYTTLTSGTPSSAITLATAGTLTVGMLKVSEPLKATRYVELLFVRE